MKKIMNSILTSIYAVTAVIGPVPVLRLIMWFVNVIVAMWQLYFLRKKIVLRSYFIKDNIIEVHNSRYLLILRSAGTVLLRPYARNKNL